MPIRKLPGSQLDTLGKKEKGLQATRSTIGNVINALSWIPIGGQIASGVYNLVDNVSSAATSKSRQKKEDDLQKRQAKQIEREAATNQASAAEKPEYEYRKSNLGQFL